MQDQDKQNHNQNPQVNQEVQADKKPQEQRNAALQEKQRSPDKPEDKMTKMDKKPEKPSLTKRKPYLVVTMLGAVDLIVLIVLFIFINSLPQKAAEVKNLRSIKQSQSFDVGRIETDIEAVSDELEELKSYTPGDEGLVEFINELDRMKSEGIVADYTFTGGALNDRLGHRGLPVVIEIRGSWQVVEQGLNRLQQLPYLIRASKVEAFESETGDGIVFKYGGILYVSEEVK